MTHSAGAGDLDAYVSTMHKMSALLRVSNFLGRLAKSFLFSTIISLFFMVNILILIGGIVLFLIMSNIGIKLKLVLSKNG